MIDYSLYLFLFLFLFFIFIFITPEVKIDKEYPSSMKSVYSEKKSINKFDQINRFKQLKFLNNRSIFDSYTLNSTLRSKQASTEPIYIPTKYVKIIEDENFIRDNSNLNKIEYLSPTPSVYPKQKYIFSENNRKFGSVSERITCKIFEEFLGYEVKTNIRPDFLKNPNTGRNLELDMYDPISRIAIEYNGIQHYKFTPKFHKNVEEFNKQIGRDKIKKQLCDENNIKLISIPYTVDSSKIDKNGDFIFIYRKPEEKEKRISLHLIPILELLTLN